MRLTMRRQTAVLCVAAALSEFGGATLLDDVGALAALFDTDTSPDAGRLLLAAALSLYLPIDVYRLRVVRCMPKFGSALACESV
jgi:hypothetical protein